MGRKYHTKPSKIVKRVAGGRGLKKWARSCAESPKHPMYEIARAWLANKRENRKRRV